MSVPLATLICVGSLSAADGGSSADKRLIVIERTTANTSTIYNGIVQGLSLLPTSVKEKLLVADITVVITPTTAELNGADGWCKFEPKNHRVVMAEQAIQGGRTLPPDFKRTPVTILHELGHAYDFIQSYPSRTDEFRRLYDDDARTIDADHRKQLEYFLQPGGRGPTECFASLFARKYYRSFDRRLVALEACFPRSFDFVKRVVN